MTDDKVTPLFKTPKKQPVIISYGPDYDQMERLGVSATFINAFRVQTLQLESVKDERDLLRHAYADLAEKTQSLAQEAEFAAEEYNRVSRQLATEQALTQKLTTRLEEVRAELAKMIGNTP